MKTIKTTDARFLPKLKTKLLTARDVAQALDLLRDSLRLFNEIPNHRTPVKEIGSSYDLAAKIERFLNEKGAR